MSSDVNLPGKDRAKKGARSVETASDTKPVTAYHVGQRVEARDSHGNWYSAKILEIANFKLLIHFQRWR